VSCCLLRAMAVRGVRAVGLKPVESGLTPDGPFGSTDGGRLADLSYRALGVAPYRFEPPLSPHLAARRAGTAIELERLVAYVHHESANGEVVLAESAGGVFSPLGVNLTNLDFALALEPALWVLVAPDSLGVLHDVSATLLAMQARGREPDFVVLSQARPRDDSTGSNGAELRALGITGEVFEFGAGDETAGTLLARALLD
jgi:dethiobiotin synthetase